MVKFFSTNLQMTVEKCLGVLLETQVKKASVELISQQPILTGRCKKHIIFADLSGDLRHPTRLLRTLTIQLCVILYLFLAYPLANQILAKLQVNNSILLII